SCERGFDSHHPLQIPSFGRFSHDPAGSSIAHIAVRRNPMPEQAGFNALDALSSRQAAWLRITADGEVITVSPPAAEMLDVPVSCPDAHLQHLIFEPEWRHLRARMAGSGMLNHENVLLWPPEGRLLHAQISTLPTGAGDYFVFIALRHAFEDAVRNMPGCADPFELGHDGMFIADEHRILVANPAL